MRFFQHRSKEAKGNLPMIILSLLLAILIWLVVAMTLYPSIPKTIENIPLSVDIAGSPAADSGLSVISCDVDTVDVQLVGSRTQIGNLNAENLTAYVDYENVTSTGKKTLSIKVKSDSGINYEVKSILPRPLLSNLINTTPCRSRSSPKYRMSSMQKERRSIRTSSPASQTSSILQVRPHSLRKFRRYMPFPTAISHSIPRIRSTATRYSYSQRTERA